MFKYYCCNKVWYSYKNITKCYDCLTLIKKIIFYSFKCCGQTWKSKNKICICYKCNKMVNCLCSVRFICECGQKWTKLSGATDKENCWKCKKLNNCQRKYPFTTCFTEKLFYRNF